VHWRRPGGSQSAGIDPPNCGTARPVCESRTARMVGTNTNNSDASRCGRGRRQGTRHSHRSDAVHQRATPGTAALNPRRGPWQRSNTWARDQRLTPNQASRTRRRQGSAQLRPTPGSQEAHRDRNRPESISRQPAALAQKALPSGGPYHGSAHVASLPTSPTAPSNVLADGRYPARPMRCFNNSDSTTSSATNLKHRSGCWIAAGWTARSACRLPAIGRSLQAM